MNECKRAASCEQTQVGTIYRRQSMSGSFKHIIIIVVVKH